MTEPLITEADRKAAREINNYLHSVPCGSPIYDGYGLVTYGCCRPKGHDGLHETLEDRHKNTYLRSSEEDVYTAIIAKHYATERERSQRIDKALEELLAWLEEDTLAIMKDTTGITFDREDCALLHGKVAEARAALEKK